MSRSPGRIHSSTLLFCLMLLSCSKEDQPAPMVTGAYSFTDAFPGLTFTKPLGLVAAPDLSGRLFVLEQGGRIVAVNPSQPAGPLAVFLDIHDRISSSAGEEGLLGMAFDPLFVQNGRFYLNYTAPNPLHTVISRFQVDPADPGRADLTSEMVLLTVNQPAENHNGGQLQFGPDGYLYIGLGDGGPGGDPENRAQSPAQLLGKILRIDVNGSVGGLPYRIPKDNPFAAAADRRPEIFAIGFRNPWRFSFDPATGLLWVADVGQGAMEEVDIVEKGKNYGWRVKEGTRCFNPSTGCDGTGLTDPVWEYAHDVGQCIIGGFVYRGSAEPGLVGAYICGDFITGRVWAVRAGGTSSATAVEIANTGLPITSFGVSTTGEIYLSAYSGKIYALRSNP